MMVEVLYFEGCPNARAAIALVRRCIARAGVAATMVERRGDYPSPSVKVNGLDVMGEPATSGSSCRLDLPTEERVTEALQRAIRGAG